MRTTITVLLLLLSAAKGLSRTEALTRLVLIGNGYESAANDGSYLTAIRNSVPFDSNTIVLFLGNNMRNADDTATLRREADIIRNTAARAFFIPGFLDWAKGREDGYRSIRAQQKFLNALGNPNIKFYPGDGCPGPKKVKVGADAVMFIMDSQWWLHEGSKPNIESDCKLRTKEDILAEIEDIPKDEFDKLVLFVTHHPMENTSIHSGSFGLKQHLFPLTDIRGMSGFYLPLPIIGSFYPITSNAISSPQDLQNRVYQEMTTTGIRTSAGVDRAFSIHPHTVFIAGQEHNIQVLQKEGRYYINSGATGVPTRVRDNKHALYVAQKQGFTLLEISPDKKLKASCFIIEGKEARQDFSKMLFDYSKTPSFDKDTTTMPELEADSFRTAINTEMGRPSKLQRFLIGPNYRKAWSTPVKMKVLHLDKELGGLKIKGIGGGHESKSLRLEDPADIKWVFRNSNKNVSAVIPEGFHETVASDYIQDMLSASHPYGSMVVAGLQKPLGIVQAIPDVYFMPNDSTLGPYRPIFANQVGMMEQRKPALNDNGQKGTTEALNEMIDEGTYLPDQKAYLQARLVDFLIADFDRHHGQVNWGTIDTGGRKVYYPIPKDRDQAFYHNTGLIMDVMRHGEYSFMVNFPYRIKHMSTMGKVGAYMDNMFMNRLTKPDWQAGISTFIATLSDTVIDTSVRRLPPEIYALDGKVISAKLKSRKTSIAEKGINYYSFISKRVNIPGSNHSDVFNISRNDSGLLVEVYGKDSSGGSLLNYSRTFDPKVTKEIRLFGFNGDDRFNIDASARGHTRLRLVGGKGADTFSVQGGLRNYLYDLNSEGNTVLDRSRTTKLFSDKAAVNEFKFRETLHNAFALPLITVGYNIEDGVIAGIGLAYRTYAFRKDPYASLQRFVASFAIASQAYMVRYKGEFIDVFRHFDLLPTVDFYNPVLKNFFGFGNETVRDTTHSVSYYRTRYDYISADLLVRKRFHRGNVMSFAAGPSFYHYWYDAGPNAGRVLENPEEVGLDSSSVVSLKTYAGGKAAFTINTLNNELLPTRGISWVTEFSALKSLNESTRSLTRLNSTLDVYAVLNQPNRLLAALHFGGGHIFSDHFEYFQALTLGGNNYLRGYRVNRFSGASMAYASAELKAKLFDFRTHLIKGDLGLVGFNDLGRVWMPGEYSKKWHHGYGGGIYLIPYNALMFSAVVGVSEEDYLFNFSIGTKLNMVFQGL